MVHLLVRVSFALSRMKQLRRRLKFIHKLKRTPLMKNLFLMLIVMAGVGAFFSCYTPPAPGSARIVVHDQNGLLVPSATLRLIQDGAPFPQGIPYIDETHMADLTGEYTSTHHNSLLVTLDIIAENDGIDGENIVTIYPDRTVERIRS